MFNCWILVLLLLCCNHGNMCFSNGTNMCGCRRDCDNDNDSRCGRRDDKDCKQGFTRTIQTPCGCDDDFVQPRTFSGFQSQNTCGCEDKSE